MCSYFMKFLAKSMNEIQGENSLRTPTQLYEEAQSVCVDNFITYFYDFHKNLMVLWGVFVFGLYQKKNHSNVKVIQNFHSVCQKKTNADYWVNFNGIEIHWTFFHLIFYIYCNVLCTYARYVLHGNVRKILLGRNIEPKFMIFWLTRTKLLLKYLRFFGCKLQNLLISLFFPWPCLT